MTKGILTSCVIPQVQSGLVVCRIKNKFLLTELEAEDGYRDVSINVLFEVPARTIISYIPLATYLSTQLLP